MSTDTATSAASEATSTASVDEAAGEDVAESTTPAGAVAAAAPTGATSSKGKGLFGGKLGVRDALEARMEERVRRSRVFAGRRLLI